MPLKLRPTGLGSDPRWSRQSALVLVADRQRPYDALGSGGDPGRGQGAVPEELGRLESAGRVGRGALSVGYWTDKGVEIFVRVPPRQPLSMAPLRPTSAGLSLQALWRRLEIPLLLCEAIKKRHECLFAGEFG